MADATSLKAARLVLEQSLGMTAQEAEAEVARQDAVSASAEQERKRHYQELDIPEKVGWGDFAYQRYDMFERVKPADRDDMYAFFEANDPSVTFDATVSLAGEGYEWHEGRYVRAAGQSNMTFADEAAALLPLAQQVKVFVEENGGEILGLNKNLMTAQQRQEEESSIARMKAEWKAATGATEDGISDFIDHIVGTSEPPLYYVEIRGNAEMLRKLAALEAVEAIMLNGDPSNLRPERERERQIEQDSRYEQLAQRNRRPGEPVLNVPEAGTSPPI